MEFTRGEERGRRIEIDPDQPPVRMSAAVLNELCAHAREAAALPEECCGLVLSDGSARYGRAVRCRNEMTALHARDPRSYPRDGSAAFYMNDHDVNAVRRDAERAGVEVTAVYHSHVGAGAYLSEMDLEYAAHPLFPFPKADQIVLPVVEHAVREPGVFRRCGDGFVGHRLLRDQP